jgi:hypothetical protein
MASGTAASDAPPTRGRDRTHWLYIAVIVAVLLGIAVGFAFPEFAVGRGVSASRSPASSSRPGTRSTSTARPST